MRRPLILALLVAAAALLAGALYRGAVSAPTAIVPHEPSTEPAPPAAPLGASPSADPASALLPREGASIQSPREPIAKNDPAIVVKARSRTEIVQGGEVRLLGERGLLQTLPLDATGEAVFRLDAPASAPQRVLLKVPGYVVTTRKLEHPGPQVVEVDLLQAGFLRVRLLDDAGRPLPNREVQSYATARVRSEPPNEIVKRCTGITDASGIAVLANVPPGQHEVTAFEYSHWAEAKIKGIDVFGGQVTETTVTTKEMAPASYAGVLFPSHVLPDAAYTDGGALRGWRLFYRLGSYTRAVTLHREWDRGFMAAIPALPAAEVEGFLAECDDKSEVKTGGRRSKPFVVLNGSTIPRVPEWER